MKLYFLGTCSGTEPMPGRHHASIALEMENGITVFDAGECCSYTFFRIGLDPLAIRNIVISHPHVDHVGGLFNLQWLITKIINRFGRKIDHEVHLYLPEMKIRDAMILLSDSLKGYPFTYSLISDGVVFEDGKLKVTARHNTHLRETQAPWHSYSFLIEAEGKKIVYSGDIGHISEIESWLDCDLLIMETGHHVAAEVCKYIRESGHNPGMMYFTHHGRAMLADTEGEILKARVYMPQAEAAYDTLTLEL